MSTRESLPSPSAGRNVADGIRERIAYHQDLAARWSAMLSALSHAPGAVMEPPADGYRARRCTGCGRTDVEVAEFRCVWSDDHTTTEWHCEAYVRVWQPQLKALGAKIERVDGPRLS